MEMEMENLENKEDLDFSNDNDVDKNFENNQENPSDYSNENQALETDNPTIEYDYKKDERFGKTWKDENDLYKSYIELEKNYEPVEKIRTDYDNLQKFFKDNGLESENLNEYLTEYRELTNPKNPRNMIADYFSDLFNKPNMRPVVEEFFTFLEKPEYQHMTPLVKGFFTFLEKPEYQPHINNFLKELQTTENQKLYPGMTGEQINEIKSMQQKLSDFENKFNEQKESEKQKQNEIELQDQVKNIENFAKEIGLSLTTDMFSELGKYSLENGFNNKHLLLAFKELFNDQIEKAKNMKQEEDILKRLNKNNQKIVPHSATKNFNTMDIPKDLNTFEKAKHIWQNIKKGE